MYDFFFLFIPGTYFKRYIRKKIISATMACSVKEQFNQFSQQA